MERAEIDAAARAFAAENDLIVWESFPWGGATALWPEDGQLEDYLHLLERVGARVLYLQDDGDVLGFAAGGVVHAFPSSEMRQRLVGEPTEDDAEVGEDDDEYGISASTPDYHNPYYDYASGRMLEGELRELVDRIVADQRFNGYRSRHLVADHVGHLAAEDAETVANVAKRVFYETVGKELDSRAQRLVPDLAVDPEFDPLARGEDLHSFLTSRLAEEDPRVLERLGIDLPAYARETGLIRNAEREITQTARLLLDTLPLLVRDQVGFTSKNTARLQLLSPYLSDAPENRKLRVLRELVSLETDLHGATREARYATAVRKLLVRGLTKAEISRRLGISTSVMDRIVSINRSDVELATDDPILTALVPGID